MIGERALTLKNKLKLRNIENTLIIRNNNYANRSTRELGVHVYVKSAPINGLRTVVFFYQGKSTTI